MLICGPKRAHSRCPAYCGKLLWANGGPVYINAVDDLAFKGVAVCDMVPQGQWVLMLSTLPGSHSKKI